GLAELPFDESWPTLLPVDLPPALILRASRLQLAAQAIRFAGHPQQLTEYLDCVEAIRSQPIPGVSVEADWFGSLFQTGRPWAPAVALVLLDQARVRSSPDNLTSLHELSKQLAGHASLASLGQSLAQALHEWSTPSVQMPPPELDRLSVLLQADM